MVRIGAYLTLTDWPCLAEGLSSPKPPRRLSLLTSLLRSMTMSEHRLFRFPKPQWLNTPNTRTAGVYLAGALVCLLKPSSGSLTETTYFQDPILVMPP